MSPHQRLVLQESWKALEDAGYNPKVLAGTNTGVLLVRNRRITIRALLLARLKRLLHHVCRIFWI